MDMWSDPNLTPFMVVTAHWVESTTGNTATGPQTKLNLRADVVGFHRVPGRHNGGHLAVAFLHITDRIKVTNKVRTMVFTLHA
jgi:hypothetical protein